MQVTLEPVFLDRFRAALCRLGCADDRLLCAVSGGPDSLALLLLAQQALPGKLVAVTVDHQLRPESAGEAKIVAEICRNLDIPHIILTPDAKISGNLQSSARTARYTLLERAADAQNCKHIATAHHADDQLETLLMRLARGSGVDGLSSIRARNGRVIRPVLEFTKAELAEICSIAGIQAVDDPSNANIDFDRVAMRNWLSSTQHPFSAPRALRTARALADASDALAWMTDTLAAQRINQVNDVIICKASGLPRELKRRLLIRCIRTMDINIAPRGEAIDRLLADLENARTAMIGNIKCLGGDDWQFSKAPPRRS
ncbi:tRNA lysidine(34) synthetase TilS [Sphingorhabdus wooponensis]|uniref:tRNA(Ile)-lysidine synthase n=1 Tax=Sphingorhabdus wooponensis TaxID=940136 RepID=A0A3R8WJT7_9SPHN|nr:tRNA lysidine(34) synthetase TilS [Sphingorhabdus wooponensis]RRQ51617.1 tRNA lysidine(34) synthetase TilS [Sphingorhabdus wooponensis]